MSEKSLSVALVSREYPPFYGGGIGTYAREIVPALRDAGVRVHVVTQAYDNECPRLEVDGLVTVHRVPLSIGRGGWSTAALRFSIDAGRVVSRLWRAGKIDVAEFAECEAGATALLTQPISRRPPTVVQFHTPSDVLFELRSAPSQRFDASVDAYFNLERFTVDAADALLAPSQFIANFAESRYLPSDQVAVIPYATAALPSVAPARPQQGSPLTVLYAGRIEPRKGVESLAVAWRTVHDAVPKARLLLAGADTAGAPDSGSMRAFLEEVIGADAMESVSFLGRLSPKALSERYEQADVCVIPSLWENFPNTCIESMGAGRAVLVGDSGGMKEMLGESEGGSVFRSGDPSDLARALTGLLREGRDALAKRGSRSRARIAYMCDPSRIARLRVDHFARVAEQYEKRVSGAAPLRDAVSAWRDFERIASGGVSSIGLPPLTDMVTRWVSKEAVAS